MRHNHKNHIGSPCRSVFDLLSILTRKRACEQLPKFWEHEQASTRLNFASKSSKGKILRAVKIFNGPFIIPYTGADGVRANKQLLCLALLLNKVSNSVEQK